MTGKAALFLLLHVLLLVVLVPAVLAQARGLRFEVGGNSDVRAGKTTSLTCNLLTKGANLSSSYIWAKDGNFFVETGKRLYLSDLTKQDAGYYQCGTNSSTYGRGIHLRVWAPGDAVAQPFIHKKNVPVLGRSFSLHCLIFGGYVKSENTVYTWYKDTAELKSQTGEMLYFDSVKEGDEGQYTCTAREGPLNTTSPHSPEVYLNPLVPPQVRIKPPGPVVKGVRGENLTLTCEVTRAFPDVPWDGYSWSYLPSPNLPQLPLQEKTSTLTLGPLTLEARGQYQCQARNDQKPQHSSLNLTGQACVTVDIVYLDNLTLTPDLEVSEGDRVTLTCGVDSLPTAQLAWTVRGQEVRHVTDNLDHYVINRFACSDSGSYMCAASNTELPGRHRHATLQLLVHCKTDNTTQSLQEGISGSVLIAVTFGSCLAALIVGLAIGNVLGLKRHRLVRKCCRSVTRRERTVASTLEMANLTEHLRPQRKEGRKAKEKHRNEFIYIKRLSC